MKNSLARFRPRATHSNHVVPWGPMRTEGTTLGVETLREGVGLRPEQRKLRSDSYAKAEEAAAYLGIAALSFIDLRRPMSCPRCAFLRAF